MFRGKKAIYLSLDPNVEPLLHPESLDEIISLFFFSTANPTDSDLLGQEKEKIVGGYDSIPFIQQFRH